MGWYSTVRQDAEEPVYRWVYRPMLLLQLGLYLFAAGRFLSTPSYAGLPGASDVLLHENHLGNIAIVASQPNPWLLGVHMGMAVVWVGGVLVNKELAHRLVRHARVRSAHRRLGALMCAVALAGCIAGPLIAWVSHGHPAMRLFLLLLPLYFLPAIALVWRTARQKRWPEHRFWVSVAFVGPAVASLWAEILIYTFGRYTPLGPWTGELAGTWTAFGLASLAVVWPAQRAWQRERSLPSFARASTSATSPSGDGHRVGSVQGGRGRTP